MEIDQIEEEIPMKSRTLKNLTENGPLPISIAKISGSSRSIPRNKDFYFYNNFHEFKSPVTEIEKKSKILLKKIGASNNFHGKQFLFPDDSKIELDDDVANDWLENVNDDIYEKLDSSLDEFKRLRKTEEESGVRIMRVKINEESENGFQMVCRKKNKKLFGSDRNVEELGINRVQEVKVATKLKPKISFHIPSIRRPQDEYKIIVNNSNQPFDHVWLSRSEDEESRFIHPLENLSVLDFVDKRDSITEPIKPAPIELTPFKFVDELKDLKQLAITLRSVDEFAVDLEHNQYRSFQGLTCLMQISTRTEDFIIDTLKLRIYIGPHLRELFKDPTKRKVMHGADRDILWLQRDFGIYVCNMFDTGQASRVLKMERNSLEYLLNHFCGVAANKEYQNADWRLRPLPLEMIKYAREDTHYLLYIYDVMKTRLLTQSAEPEASDPPLIEVYKRSYEICYQLYEKELLTDNSFLHIYGMQDAELNAQQLAVASGLYEWRDLVARTEDESTGYVLPNRTLIEIAKQMPVTPSKLRHVLKSKHPCIEQNPGAVVNLIKQCMQNASAFEEAAQYLKERRLEMANGGTALAAEESEVLLPEASEKIKAAEKVENKDVTIGSDIPDLAHFSPEKNGKEKSKLGNYIADGWMETLPVEGQFKDTRVNLSHSAEATVQALKKPNRAFGAMFGNSAKRKPTSDKKVEESTKLEQIKSTVSLPFHTFLGIDKSDIPERPKMPEVSHQVKDISVPAAATNSNLEEILSLNSSDSDAEKSAKHDSQTAINEKSDQKMEIEDGNDEPMSLTDLSSSFQKCFPTLQQQTSRSKSVGKSQLQEGFLQLKPFDYEAARKQVKFGLDRKKETMENDDDGNNKRNKRDGKRGGKKRSNDANGRMQKDEETAEFPQGRRRQAFPASGNRSATFR